MRSRYQPIISCGEQSNEPEGGFTVKPFILNATRTSTRRFGCTMPPIVATTADLKQRLNPLGYPLGRVAHPTSDRSIVHRIKAELKEKLGQKS